jgi:hypothetical protein
VKRQYLEQRIQKAVFAHLRMRRVPGAFAWHPFSGGYRRPREAAIYKSLGARPGLPDVMVLYQRRLYCLELKCSDGRLRPAQIVTHAEMRAAGAEVAVVAGLDEAIAQLESWELLKGRAQ